MNLETLSLPYEIRPHRLSGMQLLPMQWVGGVQKCEAIVIYRYLDNKNEFFGIKIGANNEFKEKIDNYESNR
jgi:hypothetical protein